MGDSSDRQASEHAGPGSAAESEGSRTRAVPLLLLTLASALLYGFSFPPFGLAALAWVALVPFLVAIRRAGRLSALLLAWVWLTAMAFTVGDCLPGAVSTYFGQPVLLGVAFAVALFWVQGAPYYMAFAACYRRVGRSTTPMLPFLAAATWVAAEFARVRVLTGNPWALFGYSQAEVTPLVQIADVTGVYGISFVLVAVNAALAELCLTAWRWERDARGCMAGLGVAGLAAALVVAYGVARLHFAPPEDDRAAKVVIVQGNLDLGSQWRQELYGKNLDTYMRLTFGASREWRPDIAFWPENAMTFFLNDEPLYQNAIATLLTPLDVELVAGGPRVVQSASQPAYYNSAFLVAPRGEIVAWYDKQYLLPFAEYFPFSGVDLLRRRFARVRAFTPGGFTAPLPTRAGPAGVLICNEAVFAEIAAARVRAGASYLVNLANDTWLGDWKYAVRIFDIVALRAIEQRRYLVRASTSGPSAIVDPWGRVTARTQPFTQEAIGGTLRGRNGLTVYCRLGDLFAVICTVAAIVFAGVLGRRPERGRSAGGG